MEFGDDSFEDFPDCDERSCCKEVYYFTSIVNLQNLWLKTFFYCFYIIKHFFFLFNYI